MSRIIACWALFALLAVSENAAAQEFSLRLDAPTGGVGYNSLTGDAVFTVDVKLQEHVPMAGTPADVIGFSLSIAYDGDVIDATAADPAGSVAGLGFSSIGPEYWGVDLANQAPGGDLGVTIGAIFALEVGAGLEFDSEDSIARLTFHTEDITFQGNSEEVTTTLRLIGTGFPQTINNLINTSAGAEVSPATTDADVNIFPSRPFTFALTPEESAVNYSTLTGEGSFTVALTIDEENTGEGSFPSDTQGFSASIVYQESVLTAVAADPSQALLDLGQGPNGAAFFGVQLAEPASIGTRSVTLGVVYTLENSVFLTFEYETEVAEITFATVAEEFAGDETGTSTQLVLAASGNPEVQNLITLAGGIDSEVNTFNANVDLVPVIERAFTFAVGTTAPVVYDSEIGSASFDLPVTIEGSPGFPNIVSGFSMALTFDDSQVTTSGATPSALLAALNGGAGADFFGVDIAPEGGVPGITIGAIFDLEGGSVLSFATAKEVLSIQFETVAAAFLGDTDGKTLNFDFASSLGDPPIENLVGIDVGERPVNTVGGQVDFNSQVVIEFKRSDCNDDGGFNIADGIFLLYYLFLDGTTPSCLASCNAMGDANLGLQDAIYIFTYQFLDGPPPAQPYPDCGAGNANDTCEEYSSCD